MSEGADRGWVKLYRKIDEWEWFADPATAHLFIYLLAKANHKPIRYKGVDIPVGGLTTSRATLAEKTGLSERQVRTALKHLISTNEVTSKTTPKFTLLIVNNYEKYQQTDQASDQQVTSERPASDQQVTTNKKPRNKEAKKPRSNTKAFSKPDCLKRIHEYTNNEDLRSALESFVDMRIGLKAPISTSRAMNGLLNKLDSLGMDDTQKIQIVDQSLQSGWKGFYPLKGNKNGRSEKPYQDFSDVIGWGPEGNIEQLIQQQREQEQRQNARASAGEGEAMDTGELPNSESDGWETQFDGWDQLF